MTSLYIPIITSDACVYIKYYANEIERIEKVPFSNLCDGNTKKEDVFLFSSVDSVIVFDSKGNEVKCIKGVTSSRNILLIENYKEKYYVNPGREQYAYYFEIRDSYFSDSNYVNPLIQ